MSAHVFEGMYAAVSAEYAHRYKDTAEAGDRFITSLEGRQDIHIDAIEGKTNIDLYSAIAERMSAQLETYDGERQERKTQEARALMRRLKGNTNRLVQEGTVDARTAKVFLRMLRAGMTMPGDDYNTIVKYHERLTPEEIKDAYVSYAPVAKQFWDD